MRDQISGATRRSWQIKRFRGQTAVDGALWLWSATVLVTILMAGLLAATVAFFIVSADIERHGGPFKAQELIEKQLQPQVSLVLTSVPHLAAVKGPGP